MVAEGALDPSRLRVQFIDEEAIFPCVDDVVRQWRETFLAMGARFDWYCLEVRHYSCLNQLENDESFICWDRHKADCWIREPPPFAIRSHPLLKPRDDTYQDFLLKVCDGPRMTGLRVFESVQRRVAIATQKPVAALSERPTIEPIYDWRDGDVWRYLAENDIEIPAAYMHLYQIGVPARALRISQFFRSTRRRLWRGSASSILASWSAFSAASRRRTSSRSIGTARCFDGAPRSRREIEGKAKPRDARAQVFALLSNIDGNFQSAGGRRLAHEFKKLLLAKPYISTSISRPSMTRSSPATPKSARTGRSSRTSSATPRTRSSRATAPSLSTPALLGPALSVRLTPRDELKPNNYNPNIVLDPQSRAARAVDPA